MLKTVYNRQVLTEQLFLSNKVSEGTKKETSEVVFLHIMNMKHNPRKLN